MTQLEKCKLVQFPKITDRRGNLSFIEGNRHVPFDIARVYYVYDVPGGEARGAHGHRALSQVLIATSGSFEVTLDDGNARRTYTLNRPFEGLLVVPMIWRELHDFASGSVCMVLASHIYDEEDYFRDYDDFLRAARTGRP